MLKLKVLFLCTGNSARSQIVEALLRARARDLFTSFSAGLVPKGMNPLTVRVMDEIGVSTEGQYSKGIREYLGKEFFSYLITVCADAEEKCLSVWPGVQNRLHWAFDDPAVVQGTEDEKLHKFRAIRDQLDAKIQTWVAEMRVQHGIIAR